MTHNQEFFVKVVEARGLKSKDFFSKSDPYVQIKLKGHMFQTHKQKGKTISNNNNPIWNEDFIVIPKSPNDVIEITIWDHDTFTFDDFIGKIDLPVSQYLNRGVCDEWRPLVGKSGGKVAGEVHLVIRYGIAPQQSYGQYPHPMAPQYPPPPVQGYGFPPNYPPQGPYQQPFPQGPYPPQPFPQASFPYQGQYPPQPAYPQQWPR